MVRGENQEKRGETPPAGDGSGDRVPDRDTEGSGLAGGGPQEGKEPSGGPVQPPAEPDKKRKKKSTKSLVLELLLMLLIAALLAVLIQSFAVKAFMIPSSSMSPTLKIGDRVLVDRVTLYFRKPRRGDIAVFRYPPREPPAMNTTNPFYWPFEQIGETLHLTHRGTQAYIKRVVGVGGETLELRKGKLYIDGKKVEEEYLKDNRDTSDFGPVKVPEGQLFLMGDNRTMSRDSRSWGTVPIRSVIGRAFLRWWPPSRIGTI